MVKAAEADAEAKFLSGQGVARQRQAIITGLRDSVTEFAGNVTDVSSKDGVCAWVWGGCKYRCSCCGLTYGCVGMICCDRSGSAACSARCLHQHNINAYIFIPYDANKYLTTCM